MHVCKELHCIQSHDLLHLQPELQKGGKAVTVAVSRLQSMPRLQQHQRQQHLFGQHWHETQSSYPVYFAGDHGPKGRDFGLKDLIISCDMLQRKDFTFQRTLFCCKKKRISGLIMCYLTNIFKIISISR